MPVYNTPGVYVEEIQTGTRPIQAVGTSTAGFIGVAPKDLWKKKNPEINATNVKDPDILDSRQNRVQYITSWTQFRNLYFPPEVMPKLETTVVLPALPAQTQAQLAAAQLTAAQQAVGQLEAAVQAAEQLSDDKEAAGQLTTVGQTAAELAAQQLAAASLAAAHLTADQKEASEQTANKQLQAVQRAVDAAKAEVDRLKTEIEAGKKPKVVNAVKLLAEAKTVVAQLAIAPQAAIQPAAAHPLAVIQPQVAQNPDLYWTHLAHAVYGFFLNGGSACYVLNVGSDDKSLSLDKALDQLDRIDEVAIVAAPGYTEQSDYELIKSHCELMKDRVGILDGPKEITNYTLERLRGNGNSEPDQGENPWIMPTPSDKGFITLYTPWLMIANPDPNAPRAQRNIAIPPSGYIAGIWARSDATRGVHKAPANEPLRGVVDLEYGFNSTEQGGLNDIGVNCIRYFTGSGYLVWGARTLFPEGNPLWKYLNVRRLFNQIEESILKGTRWIVFEPNDRPLWMAIKRDITAFLMGFWRSGALMGSTPEQAFFVKCDEENNPFDEIVKGFVHIDIGIAPVRPAEFVIFRIAQFEAGSEVSVSG